MAGEIASAFVRVRPNMTGFKPEVEHGVRSAFGGLGKIVGGALAAAGAFEFGKSLVTSAASHQAQFAILDQTLKNAGDSTRGFGQQIEGVLEKEARLKGFSDEDLAQSMVRLVSVTHDSRAAFKDLGIAEDLSRARGIDLATAALAISKAIQGRTASLQRYGIVLPKITTAEDDLKKRLIDAQINGAKVTGALKEQYDAAMKVAKATDLQAQEQEALTLIQERFGGTARTFAQTASGQFDRLRVDVHQLEVAFGGPLLGSLAGIAEGVGHLSTSLAQNKGAVAAERNVVGALRTAWDDAKTVIEEVAPVLAEVAGAGAKVVGAIGATPILAAVVAVKGLAIAESAAGAAQGLWTKAVLVGNGATVEQAAALTAKGAAADADTVATDANTAALEANTAAATANAGAQSALVLRVAAATAATGEEAAALGAAAAAMEAESVAATGALAEVGAGLTGLGGILLSAAGGPIVLGLAGVAGALAYIATRSTPADDAIRRIKADLQGLGTALQNIPGEELSAQQARLTASTARQTLETSKARRGSAEYQQQVLDLKQAELGLSTVEERLAADRQAAAGAIKKEVDDIAGFAKAARDAAANAARGAVPTRLDVVNPGAAAARAADSTSASVAKLTQTLRDEAAAYAQQSPLLSHNLGLLARYVETTNQIPSKRTTTFFLDNTNAKASLRELEAAEQKFVEGQVSVGKQAGDVLAGAFQTAAQQGLLAGLAGGAGGPAIIVATITGALRDAMDQVKLDLKAGRAARKAYEVGQAAITAVRQGITTDQQGLDLLKQQMADQVIAGAEATASAIQGAKQSFAQIGSTIAQDLATVINQPLIEAGYALQLQGDIIAAQFDAQTIRLQTKADKLNQETAAIQLAATARNARFAGENQRISNAEARAGLHADERTLANLRNQVVLPGGKQLSTDTNKALAQLQAFANHAGGISKDAVESFIDQYRAAALAVEKDKIGIATQTSPRTAQREADLGVASGRNAFAQAGVARRRASADAALQIKRDADQIAQDLNDAKARAATREIDDLIAAFNSAPSAAGLKKVTGRIAAILEADHATVGRAGRVLGAAFAQGFEGQITGLGLQGSALLGAPQQAGGGQIPSIVRPLETIRQQGEQAASLTKQYRTTTLDLQRKQHDLTKKIAGSLAAAKLASSLVRNPGGASTRARNNRGTTP